MNAPGEDHTVTATVVDQFGDPMQDVTVDFTWSLDVSENGTATDFTSSATTDSNGEVTSTWNGDDEWGPADITASANGVESTTVSKYWAENTTSQYNYQDIVLRPGMGDELAGQNFTIMLDTYDGTVIYDGMATYDNNHGTTVTTSHAFSGGEIIMINFPDDSLTNGDANWWWSQPDYY